MSKYLKILIVVVICLSVGFLASLVTRENVITWFPTLKKPFFNPPSWVFAPVWTVLYILMAIAAGLVWDKINQMPELVKKALYFFAIQLVLNALWSYIFFGLHNILLALIEIILLWLLIFETYKAFKKVDTMASTLLIPYLIWVSFATILNASLLYLN